MAENSSGGVWAAMGAVGGLLGGAASMIGLFIARPDTITVFVPVETLREVVVAADAENAPPARPAVEEVVAQPAAAVAPPPALPPRALGGGLSVSLVSIADTPEQFVATVRFTNDSDTEVFVGGRGTNRFEGDVNLTDSFGGSCAWSRGSSGSMGTLPTAHPNPTNVRIGVSEMTAVPPHGSVVNTLLFIKSRCQSSASEDHPLTLSGTFVIFENDARRQAGASFEGVTAARPN